MSNPPVLLKAIPAQIISEGAAWGPLDLNQYIQSENATDGVVRFTAELMSGSGLPDGLICTSNGTLSGIPFAGTLGSYDILITAENESGMAVTTEFKLTIKERIALDAPPDFIGNIKSRVWEALGKDLPIPDIGDILNRPITALEIYYLLQRWATITIWDVYNLDEPVGKHMLDLKDASQHYYIYDRGSCLVAAPKDLYSHERTLEDALQSARALAREVYRRGWVIEFAGFDKMVRAAWVELQLLGEENHKAVEILHYEPTVEDLKVLSAQARAPRQRRTPFE